jgi:hypothetical protein
MVPGVRWLVVAAVAVVLVSAPTLVRAIPPDGSSVGARALADRIRAAQDTGWTGEVRSHGALAVPISNSAFSGIARLLGEDTDLRVWWRTSTDWRVDRLRGTGESDLAVDGGLAVRWSYETRKVSVLPYSAIRLPEDSDIVPVSLAHRMLSGAKDSELSRLPSRRIAGHSAAGLRLVPSDHRSTIGRVDIWADDTTAIPLRVDVYAAGKPRVPIVSTQVVSFDSSRPSTKETHLDLAPGLSFSRGVSLDEAAGANAFAPFVPPARLVGLARLGDPVDFGAVGVYGRGPTAILAIPLRGYVARGLRDQMRKSATSREVGNGVALEVGPISILLSDIAHGHFLITGTVTPATLQAASRDLDRSVQRISR